MSSDNATSVTEVNQDLGEHVMKKQICPICLKSFKKKYLKVHLSVHSADKPFTCDICLKRFSRKQYLIDHIKVHSRGKSFTCPICLKNFGLKHHLKQHLVIHSGEKPYICSLCQKCFSFNFLLKKHIMTSHSDEVRKSKRINKTKVSCSVCFKQLSSIWHLKRHKSYVHSEEKPFQCPICLKSFRRKDKLSTHVKVHAESKRHKCSKCSQKFRLKRDLKEHNRFHGKEKSNRKSFFKNQPNQNSVERYTCDTCKRDFSQKNKLKTHINNCSEKQIHKSAAGISGQKECIIAKQRVSSLPKLGHHPQDMMTYNSGLMIRKQVKIVLHKLTIEEMELYTSKGETNPRNGSTNVTIKKEPEALFGPACINVYNDLFIKTEENIS